MSIIEKLRMRKQERALTLKEKRAKLVEDVWSGKQLSEETVEAVLSECGMSDTDLESELTRLDQIAAAKVKLVNEKEVMNELRSLAVEAVAADKAFVDYQTKFTKDADLRKSRDGSLRWKLEESKKAENILSLIRNDHDNDAITDPKSVTEYQRR